MSGYARAYRGRWEHHVFKSKQEAAVWAWMTDTARFRAHEFQTRFGIVRLERGQVLVSERTIGEDFGLGRQQVRRLMDTMEINGMIHRNSTHSASRAGTIVTIQNYAKYQGFGEEVEALETQGQPKRQPITNPRATHNQPTREEREKGEEREEDTPSESSISDRSAPEAQLLPDELPVANTLPTVDEVGPAFERYQACRASLVPGARPLSLSPDRRRGLAARLAEIGGATAWDEVLARIRGSPFLRGETSRNGFVAEIDWLLKPINLRKVMEGNYDERPSANPRRQSASIGAVDAMREARDRLGLG